jgi:N-acyl homoserine lactone hydrolase
MRHAPDPDQRPTSTSILVAHLNPEGSPMPVYVHVVDHPEARVLVDTGLTAVHPLVEDMDPQLVPLGPEADALLAGVDLVVNTHLHFDHCGGNHRFAGTPTYVQQRELDDARAGNYTILEWVDAPGMEYVPVDGELELLPGLRLVPAPGHTPGSQVVVVEVDGRPVVIAGDTAVFPEELDQPRTEGQRLIRALDPVLVWLSHQDEPWRPRG